MMAIGDTGSGKSSLLNALLCPKKLYYEYEDCYFQTGSSLETGNSSIVSQTGPWLDNLGEYIGKVTLYDTPGILDQTGADVNNETLRQIARNTYKKIFTIVLFHENGFWVISVIRDRKTLKVFTK